MVAHASHPTTGKARTGISEFEASLAYIVPMQPELYQKILSHKDFKQVVKGGW